MTINELLVKKLLISHTDAISAIAAKKIVINGKPATQKQPIYDRDQILFEEKEIQSPKFFKYLIYYKPRGVECTLNPEIENNLLQAFPLAGGLFPVGRLDKDSEGLLLLTNDGDFYRKTAPSENLKGKEYEVCVDKALTDEALRQMETGIVIMGKRTRPAQVFKLDDCTFRIIITQGLNRQIRRMCYKLGYEVQMLKRTRIDNVTLGNLKPGEYRQWGMSNGE